MVGFMHREVFLGPVNPFWGHTLFVEPASQTADNEFLNSWLKLFPVLGSTFGIWLSVNISLLGSQWVDWTPHFEYTMEVRKLLTNKWYIDFSVNHGIVMPWLNICDRITFQVLDKGILSIFGPAGSNIWQEFPTSFQSVGGHLFHSIQIILIFIAATCSATWLTVFLFLEVKKVIMILETYIYSILLSFGLILLIYSWSMFDHSRRFSSNFSCLVMWFLVILWLRTSFTSDGIRGN